MGFQDGYPPGGQGMAYPSRFRILYFKLRLLNSEFSSLAALAYRGKQRKLQLCDFSTDHLTRVAIDSAS
jgi:hypothetical protein